MLKLTDIRKSFNIGTVNEKLALDGVVRAHTFEEWIEKRDY